MDSVLSGLGQGGKIIAEGIGFVIPVTQVQSWLTAINKRDISSVSTLQKPQTDVQSLSLNGQIINDNLTKDQPEKYYLFEGKAGQKISLEMDIQVFDPQLT